MMEKLIILLWLGKGVGGYIFNANLQPKMHVSSSKIDVKDWQIWASVGIAAFLLLLCSIVQICRHKHKKMKREQIKRDIVKHPTERPSSPPPRYVPGAFSLPPPPDFGSTNFTPQYAQNTPATFDIFAAHTPARPHVMLEDTWEDYNSPVDKSFTDIKQANKGSSQVNLTIQKLQIKKKNIWI